MKKVSVWKGRRDLGRESANVRPAIIIGERRAGGTLMACCLSNHPEVYCDRWEPLNSGSLWYRMFPDDVDRLHLLLHQPYYKVSACKLLPQHTWREPVATYLKRHRPAVRVIHVYRENILAQAVSCVINLHSRQGAMGHPTHAFESVEPPPVVLAPDEVVAWCTAVTNHHTKACEWVRTSKLPVLRVAYEEMTDERDVQELPGELAERICNFLDVEVRPLYTLMHKVHDTRLDRLVTNWPDIAKKVQGTKYARFLEVERG
jgi:LPS sulfotransferase NodH